MISKATVAVILSVTGAIWIIQGFSLASTGSFMDGDRFWGWMGIACLAGAAAMVFLILKQRRTGQR